MSERSIFIAALEKDDATERSAYLDKACAGDVLMRARIDRLLNAHEPTDSFLERGPAVLDATDNYEPIAECPGTVIGPYKLMEQIGEGGMGLVFVAEQQQPVRRRVALKIIKPGMDSRQVVARFEAERQALAILDHQNIAKVLDAGTTASGRPYFVMELVHGVPITTYCDSNQITTRQRLELFIPICHAIQHAHQKGIIHRDIKPSNILVTMYDDKPVPKVIDFGVAKAIEQRLTEKTIYTQFGTLVGTFEYMSPEQAEMNAFGVDTRSDIYSLGVLLYELLTGTTPLERPRLKEAALGEIVRLIKEEDPPPPSVRLSTSGALAKVASARKADPVKLSRLIRGELDWVVMKCLEKQRTRRYDSAGSLARDVERYLKDEAIEARPPSAWYRFGKLARRHKAALVTVALVIAALVVGTIVSTWQAIRATVAEKAARSSEQAARSSEQVAQKRKDEADDARELAEKRRDELAAVNENLRRASYVADMNLARVAWDENNLGRSRELLEKHRPRPGETDLRGFEWHYLRRLFQRDLLTVKAHVGGVTAVAFTPDGKRLVTFGLSRTRQKMSDPRPGEVKIWDAATGQPLRVQLSGLADNVAPAAALSSDGTHLAATQLNHTVLVWDLTSDGPVALEGPATLTARDVRFSPDGERLVCVYRPIDDIRLTDSPLSIRIWDLVTRQAIVTIDRLPNGVKTPTFSPDGKLLAAIVQHWAFVKVWDAATGHEVFSGQLTDGQNVADVAFSPNGKRLAACGGGGEIRIWDVASRETPVTWPSQSRFGECMAFSPDGKRLAVGGIEGMVEVWDTATGQSVHTFKGHFGAVDTLAFSPDGTRLATGSADGTLRLWDTTARRDSVSIPKDAFSARGSFQLSPDGQTLLTSLEWGVRSPLRVWDTATGEPRGGPIELPQPVVSVDWTADGKRLYLRDSAKTIHVVDVASGKVVRTFPVDAERNVYHIAVSPDEKWCAHSGPGSTIQVRDAQTGALFRTHNGLEGKVPVLAFSPDGSRLLGADEHGALKIWDISTGREIVATAFPGVLIQVARFSADGKRVAVGGLLGQLLTGEVRILDAEDAREIWSLKGHTLVVGNAVFSPDGMRLATASNDETVRLWDLGTGQEILKLSDAGYLERIRFVSNGHRLIVASPYRGIRIWDATPLPE